MTETKIYETLSDLEQSGKLKILIRAGFCSPCILRNLEMYRFIDARVRTGTKVDAAVLESEVAFNLCRRQVYRIIKSFK